MLVPADQASNEWMPQSFLPVRSQAAKPTPLSGTGEPKKRWSPAVQADMGAEWSASQPPGPAWPLSQAEFSGWWSVTFG